MYFALKINFMHCMHHHLVLFAFVCSQDWNIIFQFKNLFNKKIICLGYMLPNKIFCCLQSLSSDLFELFEFACLNLIYDCLIKLFLIVAI